MVVYFINKEFVLKVNANFIIRQLKNQEVSFKAYGFLDGKIVYRDLTILLFGLLVIWVANMNEPLWGPLA